MQNERSTSRRRIGDNLYERTTKTGERRFVVGYLEDGGGWRMVTLQARNRTEAKGERDEFLAKRRRGEIAPVSKITLAEFIDEYLDHLASLVAAGERAERTLERYRSHLEGHVVPAIGHLQLRKLSADHLARLVRTSREKGLAPWTIKGMLTPLGRVLALAQRRGLIVENPLQRLQPEELPKGVAKDPPRVLSREEIAALLARSPDRYRPIIGVAVFAGLRQAEVLGLRWSEIDFKTGVLRVRHQLTRGDRSTPPRAARLKTKAGIRDVIILADLATLLQRHLGATEKEHGLPRSDDFVFTTSTGWSDELPQRLDPRARQSGRSRESQSDRRREAHVPRPAPYLWLPPRPEWP